MINRTFLLAGKATFTVDNGKGEHYTFKATTKDGYQQGTKVTFLSVLTGPDNTSDFTYLGMINSGEVTLTKKSKYNADSKLYKVAKWAVRQVYHNLDLPEGYNIQHAGKCGKCGRKLTTPQSIATGLGPKCAASL
jgi:hypothetical protein